MARLRGSGGRTPSRPRLRLGNYRGARGRSRSGPRAAPGKPLAVRYRRVRGSPGPIYLVMALFGLLFVGFGLFWDSVAG